MMNTIFLAQSKSQVITHSFWQLSVRMGSYLQLLYLQLAVITHPAKEKIIVSSRIQERKSTSENEARKTVKRKKKWHTLHSSTLNPFSAESRKYIQKTWTELSVELPLELHETCFILTYFWFIKIAMKQWQGNLAKSNAIKHCRSGKKRTRSPAFVRNLS